MELIAKREKVVEVATPWMRSAPLDTLSFYIEEERSPLRVSWALVRYLRRLTNQVRHSCDRDKQSHLADLAENMRCARELYDARTAWQRARDIVGMALGPRDRVFFCSSRRMPSDTSRRGPLHANNFWGEKKLTPRSSPGPTLARNRLMDLRRALLRQRHFKAHPRDTLTQRYGKFLLASLPVSEDDGQHDA